MCLLGSEQLAKATDHIWHGAAALPATSLPAASLPAMLKVINITLALGLFYLNVSAQSLIGCIL